MRLCVKQGVDVDFIVTKGHVMSVIQIDENQGYGVQYQYLSEFTSYERNYLPRTIYDNAEFKYDNYGAAFITNRTRKTNYGSVFIDIIEIPNLWDYYELRNN